MLDRQQDAHGHGRQGCWHRQLYQVPRRGWASIANRPEPGNQGHNWSDMEGLVKLIRYRHSNCQAAEVGRTSYKLRKCHCQSLTTGPALLWMLPSHRMLRPRILGKRIQAPWAHFLILLPAPISHRTPSSHCPIPSFRNQRMRHCIRWLPPLQMARPIIAGLVIWKIIGRVCRVAGMSWP